MNLIEKLGLKRCQEIVDELKAKNIQLTHALVNANAEKSKWAKEYWQQVERCAEYGAMLMADPDSLEFKCYQKEKQNEELTKQLRALTSQLNNMEACYIEKKKQVEDALSRIESLMVHAAADYENTKSTSMMCAVQELGKTLRGEHE